MAFQDEDIGPLANLRVAWQVIHYVTNSPPEDQKKCLREFINNVLRGTVRVSAQNSGHVKEVRICGHIVEFGSDIITDINVDLTVP